jgi:hypothetical protein
MQYYVKFVGYMAQIVTKKEEIHAILDFLTGSTSLKVSGGYVIVPNRCALGPYIASLLTCLNDPDEKSKLSMTRHGVSSTELTHGEDRIRLAPGADPKKVIRRLANRFRQIEPVLEHADIVGSQIERRPYSEYLDEIEATGFAQPKVHGLGVFDKGKFFFHPLNLTAVVKPTEREDFFQVEYVDSSPEEAKICSGQATPK